MARKYFGEDTPLGKTLEFNRTHLMEVKAVIEDLPSNTHVAAQIFGSAKTPFSNLAQRDAHTDSFHFDGMKGQREKMDNQAAQAPTLVTGRNT